MQTIASDSHVIPALVKYAQELDTPSFDAAIDVYIAWGKTVNSEDRLLLCQALQVRTLHRARTYVRSSFSVTR